MVLPEEAVGGEIGYGGVTVFRYNFSEGIDYDSEGSMYMNTGSYATEGVRFAKMFAINSSAFSLEKTSRLMLWGCSPLPEKRPVRPAPFQRKVLWTRPSTCWCAATANFLSADEPASLIYSRS